MKLFLLFFLSLTLPLALATEPCGFQVGTALDTGLGYRIQTRLEGRPPAPWKLAESEEAEFLRIQEDESLSDQEVVARVYDLLLRSRIASLPPSTRLLTHLAARDLLKQKSLYSRTVGWFLSGFYGPHYNPVFNRVAIPNVNRSSPAPEESMFAVHEFEHAVHRNTNPIPFFSQWVFRAVELTMVVRTPFTPILTHEIEEHGIGAQWEMVQRIPEKVRQSLILSIEERSKKEVLSKAVRIEMASVIRSGLLAHARELARKLLDPNDFDLESIAFEMVGWGIHSSHTRSVLFKKGREILDRKEYRLLKSLAKKGRTGAPAQKFLRREIERWSALLSRRKNIHMELEKESDFKDFERMVQETKLRTPGKVLVGNFQNIMEQLFYVSLKHAHLSKAEFLAKVAPYHGYSMDRNFKRQYQIDAVKFFLLTFSLLGIAHAMVTDSPPFIIARDLDLLYRFFEWIF